MMSQAMAIARIHNSKMIQVIRGITRLSIFGFDIGIDRQQVIVPSIAMHGRHRNNNGTSDRIYHRIPIMWSTAAVGLLNANTSGRGLDRTSKIAAPFCDASHKVFAESHLLGLEFREYLPVLISAATRKTPSWAKRGRCHTRQIWQVGV
jgi:hypothetical protein